MTNDPIFSALLVAGVITGALLIAGLFAIVVDRMVNSVLPPFERTKADMMRDHIRRMQR